MALKQEMKNKILEEITYFTQYLALETGYFVDPVKDGAEEVYVTTIDGEEFVYTKDNVIKVVFDEKVKERISEYTRYLVGIRGIKDLADIDDNDPEVQSILRNIRVQKSVNNKQYKVTKVDRTAAINLVKQKYEPQYRLAAFQIIVWALVRDDLFRAVNSGGKKLLDCRFDVTVPDNYWDTDFNGDDLDSIFLANRPEPVPRDKNDPLEIALAITTTLMDKYEDFSKSLGELVAVVFSNLMAAQGEYESEETFRTELVGFLPASLVAKNPFING